MFCEKCGNKLNDGDKFCMKCGNPVPQDNAPQQTVPAQPVAPTPQETAPVQPLDYAPHDTIPVQPVAPAKPKEPRKPMSPKTKKLIIFSSIGAGVLAIVLIVLFAFILPMLNRVDISEYITSEIDEVMLYEEHISGTVEIDSDAIYAEHLAEKSGGKTNINSFSDLLNGLSSYSAEEYLDEIIDYCIVDVAVKGVEKTEPTTTENEYGYEDSYYEGSTEFENCKSSDVLVVTLKWKDNPEEQRRVEILEKKAGISFDKSEKTLELAIKDILADKGLSVRETVNVDLFKYIDENNLVKVTGTKDGDLKFSIKGFTFNEGNYTFTKEENERSLTISDGVNEDQTLYIENASSSYLSDGDTVDVVLYGFNSEENEACHLSGTDVFFTSTSKTYDIKANEPMTLDQAKENVDLIKSSATHIIKDVIWSNVEPVVLEAYFLQSKGTASCENKIVVVYKDTIDNDYSTFYFENAHFVNDELCYDRCNNEIHWKNKTAEDVKKSSYILTDKEYTSTKIG